MTIINGTGLFGIESNIKTALPITYPDISLYRDVAIYISDKAIERRNLIEFNRLRLNERNENVPNTHPRLRCSRVEVLALCILL